MQALTIDPAATYLIPTDVPIHILLVGCGGTGSHIAQAVARLAYHVQARGDLPPISLTLMDGDTVERKNVGRQLFSLADVGRNKAEALAARFSAVFGLQVEACPDFIGLGKLPKTRDHYGVLVGAVDTPAARREIHRALDAMGGGWRLWLDAGNERYDGQVAVGGAVHSKLLHKSFALPGVCSAIPAPHLVYPDLVVERKRSRIELACAEAMQADAQSLMVNQAMASIVSQYLYQIVIARRLTTFATGIDLDSLNMRSQPLTAAAVSAATGVSIAELRGLEEAPKKTRRGRKAA